MLEGYERRTKPERAEREHKLLLPQRQHPSPGHAVNGAPAGQHEDDDEVCQTLARERDKQQNENDLRERNKDFRHTKDRRVQKASTVPAITAQSHPDERRAKGSAYTHRY